MHYEWDPAKAVANKRKHGIDFADAVGVFGDESALRREDPDTVGEQRFVALGLDALGRVVVVVYTYRGDCFRLISARKATKKERGYYAQENS